MRPRSAYIFVDSSAWYALVNARDKNHLAAKRFLEASHRLLTTNFVVDETITPNLLGFCLTPPTRS